MQQICNYDPTKTDPSVSMHHCPLCGEMVIAGIPHPPHPDSATEDYWDSISNKAEEEKTAITEALMESATSCDFDPCVTGEPITD